MIKDTASRLVVGLGNPGRKYMRTRHNIGFMLIDRLGNHFGISPDQTKFKCLFGQGIYRENRLFLVQPMDFMNRSGPPVFQLARYFNISLDDTLIIHDDVDLDIGRIKIKAKGGHGGHNGIKSIIDAFGSDNFPRIRIGIGRPEPPVDVTDYVLGKFTPEELQNLEPVLKKAEDAVETVLNKGTTVAMNHFNCLIDG